MSQIIIREVIEDVPAIIVYDDQIGGRVYDPNIMAQTISDILTSDENLLDDDEINVLCIVKDILRGIDNAIYQAENKVIKIPVVEE